MREAPVGMDRPVGWSTADQGAVPSVPTPEPTLADRLAGAGSAVLHAVRAVARQPRAAVRHGARRRRDVLDPYLLAIAAGFVLAASSLFGSVRRRAAADGRLVTAFLLSMVLVASTLAGAGPSEAIGNAAGGGTTEPGRIAALDSVPVGADNAGALERDEIDAGVGYDPVVAAGIAEDPTTAGAPYLPDGTLLKPVAIEGAFPGLQRSDVSTYRVRSGDTLTGIASRFHVSMMTLWWANKLSSKDQLKVGRELVIPPVSGLLWTVREGDTLDSIAKTTKADVDDIRSFNGLTSDTLILGQELMVPGGRGDPIPTPKPTPKAAAKPAAKSPPVRYSGGSLRWPVAGGYVSQYYSAYHRAIDIAANYGTSVMAAAYGKVVFAGWRSNCGGYQIWVSHGNGMYTGYYHLSAILAGAGSYVGRGQQIARVGTSGCTTGPHLHFEVRLGSSYDSATRVNPLYYL